MNYSVEWTRKAREQQLADIWLAAANRKAVQKAPGLLSGYENLFQLQLQNNQPAEALKTLDEAARVASKDPSFWIGLAEMYSNYLRLRVGEAAAGALCEYEVPRAIERYDIPRRPVPTGRGEPAS